MTNLGAAWGVFAILLKRAADSRICLIAGLIIYLFWLNKESSRQLPLMLIIAGTGNVLDYFIYGHVVDMLHFVIWGFDFPVFNLADTSISIGIALLFILSFCKRKSMSSSPPAISIRPTTGPALQASKWQACPALLDIDEMKALMAALAPFKIVQVSGIIPTGQEVILEEQFLQIYEHYVCSLKGRNPKR